MSQNELRPLFSAALDEVDRAKSLIEQAIKILNQEETAPTSTSSLETAKGDEITLVGKIGRPQLTQTPNGIALWEAGMQVNNETGGKEWINIQAWRKTAIYASESLPSASIATAIGRFETEQWTDEQGRQRERRKFVVKHFAEAK